MADSTTRPAWTRQAGRIVAVAAVLAAVVVAARSAERATVTDVVTIPDQRTVRADRLGNGTPVFVVHTTAEPPAGEPAIDVIQAFTTEVEGPVTGLVGWCAASGQFVDPHHGALYDFRGRRFPSSLRGRRPQGATANVTALDDLVHRVAKPVAGRTEPDDPVVVTGIQELQPWQVERRPRLRQTVPPIHCRLPVDPVTPPPTVTDRRRMVDHSFLAAPIAADTEGWQITDGWIVISGKGQVDWCDAEPNDASPPACPEPRQDIRLGFDISPSAAGGVSTVIGGPLAVRADQGTVRRVAVLPTSTWRGSSLRGTERYTGRYLSLHPARGVMHLKGLRPSPGGHCEAAFPRSPLEDSTGTAVPVSGQTRVELDLDGRPDGTTVRPRVEVVVDTVTCDALVVRDLT